MIKKLSVIFFWRHLRGEKKRYYYLLLIGLLVVILPLINWHFFQVQKATAAWFNQSWGYRTGYKITNNKGSVITSLQQPFIVNTSTLITAGKMQSTCNDLRVTDVLGKVLPFYLDTAAGACNTTTTKIWVLVPSLQTGTTDIYMYYGNPNAQSTSNIGNFSNVAGVQGYYNFNEGSGTSVGDSSGNAFGGTITTGGGSTWTASGEVGNAGNFNAGFVDYVDISGIKNKIASGNFSIEMWLFPTNSSGQNLYTFTLDDATSTNNVQVYQDGTTHKWAFAVEDSGTTTHVLLSNSAITLSKWYHVVGTFNTTSGMALYVNGVLQSTDATITARGTTNSTTTTIGGDQNQSLYFTGTIDEVKIFSSTLTAQQANYDFSYPSSFYIATGLSTDTSTSASSEEKGTAPIVYFKFNENNGTTANNSGSAGGLDKGTLSGSTKPSWTNAGKFGSALSFGGSNAYLTAGNDATVQLTSDVTMSAWVNLTTNNAVHDIVAKNGASGQFGYRLYTDANGKLNFQMSQNGTATYTATSSATLSTGTWYHVAGVYSSGGTMTVYVNGNNSGTNNTNIPNSVKNSSANLEVGSENGGTANLMNGTIDEVKVYNYALTQTQIGVDENRSAGAVQGALSNSTSGNQVNSAAAEYCVPGDATTCTAPVGRWDFEEGTGTSTNDTSGNGATGTWHGTGKTHWVPGKIGSAANFNGTNDYVDLGTPNSLNLPSNMTISMWIKVTSADLTGSGAELLGDCNPSGGNTCQYDLFITTGNNIQFDWYPCCNAVTFITTSSFTPVAGVWYHIEAVRTSNTTAIMYINGVAQTDTASGTNAPATSGYLNTTIGDDPTGGGSFQGQIDQVRIYGYARSARQVAWDYNRGAPVGYWKLNERYGTTANNSGGAGGVDNGTLSGSTKPSWTTAGKFGSALSFGGSNAYVTTGNDASVQQIANLTVSAWVKLTDHTSVHDIIAKDGASGQFGYRLFTDTNGNLNMEVSKNGTAVTGGTSGATVTGATTLANATWYHVVGVYTPSTSLTIYVNGSQDGTNASVPSALKNSSANLEIGSQNGGTTLMNGTIDEVKLYNYSLTTAQIGVDYNQSSGAVIGALSDTTSGNQVNSAAAEYCIPGDASTCTAPVGRWDFEERQGTTVNDTSGNGNTGTWQGTLGSQWTSGKIGTAGKFNGTDNNVNGGSASSLDDLVSQGNGGMTFEAWVKPTSLGGTNTIAGKASSGNPDNGWSIQTGNGKDLWFEQAFSGGGIGEEAAAGAITLNVWQYVSITWDGSTTASHIHIYINGKEQSYTTQTNAGGSRVSDASQNLLIGSDPAGDFWNGNIDQVRVFNYIRTPAQIAWDYNRGAPVAWYKFDEGQGATVHDSSVNRNDGTITIGGSGSQSAPGDINTSGTAWFNGKNGKFNYSLNLDGTDDYIQGNSVTNLPTGDLTIAAWIKTTSGGAVQYIFDADDSMIFKLNDNSTPNSLEIYLQDHTSSTTVQAATSIPINTWTHVVATRLGSTIKLYINGKQDATTGSYANALTYQSCTKFLIGADTTDGCNPNGGSNFNGQIDDFRIYNYALTSNQIQNLYNGGAAIRYGPVTGAP